MFLRSFIVAPVLPQLLLLSLFTAAAMFHLVSAYVMGLNGFLWSFDATYPASFSSINLSWA